MFEGPLQEAASKASSPSARTGLTVSGRGRDWLKIKCNLEQDIHRRRLHDLVSKNRPFSSLLLAVNEGGGLRYFGERRHRLL